MEDIIIPKIDRLTNRIIQNVSIRMTQKELLFLIEETVNYKTEKISREVNDKFAEMEKQKETLTEHYDAITADLTKQQEQMFKDVETYFLESDYLKKLKESILNYLSQEIAVRLSEKEMQTLIKNKIEANLTTNFNPLVEQILEKITRSMINKFSKELQITKEMCYCIEQEVKHTMARTGLSVPIETEIRHKITDLFEKHTEQIMLQIERKGN